ncbi:hypothetical protein [Pseudomonas sp. NA-150]|uniref:hypothetical protein n=1 Tax=Pseudomonas sp. NA-150 TaxID=3367525 RepID=UPI0037C8E45C
MLENLTPHKSKLLKLPIVLSEQAWLETVFIQNFLFVELNDRLNAVLESFYRELLLQAESNVVAFGLYRFPPTGDRQYRHWLDLQAVIEHRSGEPVLIRIRLKTEHVDTALINT